MTTYWVAVLKVSIAFGEMYGEETPHPLTAALAQLPALRVVSVLLTSIKPHYGGSREFEDGGVHPVGETRYYEVIYER